MKLNPSAHRTNGPFFQAVVGLMIGLTLQLGFVQTSPCGGIQTAENASDVCEAAVRGNPLGNPKSEARSPRQIRTPKSEPEFGKRKPLIHAHPRSLGGMRHAEAEVPFTFRVDRPGERVPLRSAKMSEDQRSNHGFQAQTRDAASEAAARGLSDSDGWLDPTVDADFNDRFIQQKLGEIGSGISNAFVCVRDQIGYEAYVGSLRGARGTMWSQVGNSLDQASLLIALLRGQGIGARYAHGTLSTNDALVLIRSMFDPVVAANAVGYIPERFPTYNPETDPGLLRWSVDHWWVELQDGTELDPSFADAAIGEARATPTATCFEVPDELRHKVIVRLKAEFNNPLSRYTYQTPLEATFSTPEVYGKAITLGHFINVYAPPAVVTGFKTYTYSPYLMVDDNDEDWSNNEVIQGTNYQEFLTGLFPLANSVLTRLTLEFEVRDPGKEPDIRTRDIFDRVDYAARKGLAQPGPVDTSKPAFTELDVTTFFITPGFIAPDMVPPHQAILAALDPEMTTLGQTMAALTNKPPESLTAEDQAAANRYATLNRAAIISGGSVVAGAFLLDSDYYLRLMRDSHLVHAYYNTPRITLFETRTDLGGAEPAMRMGLDLRRNHVLAVPYPGQSAFDFFSFNLCKGRVDSILEYLTVEHFLAGDFREVRHVASPVKVLQEAKAQGVRLEVLRGEQDIPTRLEPLPLSAEAKARSADALCTGHVVNVPVRMIEVDGRPSIGWWQVDLKTGEAVAVGEDGGNQSYMQMSLIVAIIAIGTYFTLAKLGDITRDIYENILHKLQKADPNDPENQKPLNPEHQVGNALSSSGGATIQPSYSELSVAANVVSSKTFKVNDKVLTIRCTSDSPSSATCDTAGVGGSVIRWGGEHIEVIDWLNPGPSSISNSVVHGPDFSLELVPEPTFSVAVGEANLPSAFRARVSPVSQPAPANLQGYDDLVGQSFLFTLTGSVAGAVWGTDIYFWNSALAAAAVHAGVLTNGQTGTVKVTVLGTQPSYTGSTRNGVMSYSGGAASPSYRFDAIHPSMDQTAFHLSGIAPAGWNLLFARTNCAVPAGATGDTSVFLQPQAQTALPPPGTVVPFSLTVAHADDPSLSVTQQVNFAMPVVNGLTLTASPETLYASPNGSVALELACVNVGNVTQQVALALTLPTHFTATSLATPTILAPGDVSTQSVTVTALNAPVGTEADGSVTATYGGTNALEKRVVLVLHVAAPGALQALASANDAQALDRAALSQTLETLGDSLSQLYGDPTNEVLRSRVVAALGALTAQLDDPLLTPFVANLDDARQAVMTAAPADLPAALETLGAALSPFAERLAALAQHDCEISFQPNSAAALPDLPTRFGLRLRNKGTRTTTYHLELSSLPPGIVGGLNTNQITLGPGEAIWPGLADAQEVFVTLTQPTNELTAFDFSATASAEGNPEITRTADAAFTARDELVKVVTVQASPSFVVPVETRTTSGLFTGGDPGEGLDLDGNFRYAVNIGGTGGTATVRDAHFTSDNVQGVTVSSSSTANLTPDLGASDNDDELEQVMSVFRWSGWRGGAPPMQVSLTGLTVGRPYKLQLLFMENNPAADGLNRQFDVLVNGERIADSFAPPKITDGARMDRGAVLTHEFIASDTKLTVALDGSAASENYSEPVLYGLTLEALPAPLVNVSARVLNAVNVDRTVRLQYALKDAAGNTMRFSTPQEAPLSVLSSLDTFDLGEFDPAGLPSGNYVLEFTASDLDGNPIPGSTGTCPFRVGSPVIASMSVAPEVLPPGDGLVDVGMEIGLARGRNERGLWLTGLLDTPGEARTIALRYPYAYVGGTEGVSVIDVSDPTHPRLAGTFETNEWQLNINGDHLLASDGGTLRVYGLTDPEQPNLLGSVGSGVTGATYPTYFSSVGSLAYQNTLIFAWSVVSPLQVRGDLLCFDTSDASAPMSHGLVYNTPHSVYPQFVGSDHFVGEKSDHRDGILLLPSTTGTNAAAESGTGCLRRIDAEATNGPAEIGQFEVPGTRLLQAVAVNGNRALVLGNTGGFELDNGSPVLTGQMTLTLLDVSNVRAPVVLSSNQELSGIDSPVWEARVFAGPPNLYFMAGVTCGNLPTLIIVDASDPAAISLTRVPVPAKANWATVESNYLYTASSSGLAVYDLGLLAGLPVTLEARVPNGAGTSVMPGSFNIEPDEILPGNGFDTLVWHTELSSQTTNRVLSWKSGIAGLQSGENRQVTLGANVQYTLGGTTATNELPPLSVVGEQILSLSPATQTIRPGESARFDLTLRNPWSAPAHYSLGLAGVPAGWADLPETVALAAGGEQTIPLTLAPRTLAALGEHEFVVRARTQDGGFGTVGGSLILAGTPAVKADAHGVVVSLEPEHATAGQGTPAHYAVRVVNTGNSTEEYGLSAHVQAFFAAYFSKTNVEIMPGLDNCREVLLTVTPAPGTAPGNVPFTVTATSMNEPAAQGQTTGTVSVVNLGVGLNLSPASTAPGGTFTLAITNTGLQSQAFDLALGGPVALSATLPTTAVTLAAGAGRTLFIPVAKLDYGYPGDLALTVLATARGNTNVQARASAAVRALPEHGVTAQFEPLTVRLPGPGTGFALLTVRNSGNAEDAFTARVIGVAGPLTASLQGLDGQPVQQVDTFRLPGLAAGAVLLTADMSSAGTGTVQVVVSSLLNSNVSAHATVRFQSGVRLRIAPEWIAELTYSPVPGKDHYFEYTDSLQPGLVDWKELPGGPYNRGWYYLALPGNCAAFAPDLSDTNRLFLECAIQSSRYYRLRVEAGSAPALRGHLFQVSALKFNPVPGFDHVVQYTDKLGPEAHWIDLPRGPHNHGLAFDPRTETQRFYRVVIRPQTSP